jgi:hypothetical protein
MSVPQFHLAEVLQMHSMAGRSGCLQVRHDDLVGEIFLNRGLVIHAVCRALKGPKAFTMIMRWPPSPFEWKAGAEPGISTMQEELQNLLIQQEFAAQLTEEESALLLAFGDPEIDTQEPVEVADDSILFGCAVVAQDMEPLRFEFEGVEGVIGRVPEFCHLVIPHPSVSGKHGIVRLAGHRLHYQDLGSTNGSKFHGKLVTQAELRPGEFLMVGNTRLQFFAVDPQNQLREGVNLSPEVIAGLMALPLLEWNEPSAGLVEMAPRSRKKLTARLDPVNPENLPKEL